MQADVSALQAVISAVQLISAVHAPQTQAARVRFFEGRGAIHGS